VVFYAVVSDEIEQVIEFFVDREDAETMLARVLVDEPEWEDTMRIEPVELATGGLNYSPASAFRQNMSGNWDCPREPTLGSGRPRL
jgi:hypothetical protein